jgi:ElaB/YqjD/DUF883 family membrane-anchored ribosome-binding protein
MITARTGNESLHEALAHLNEAAKERREEIQKLVNDKYTNLGDTLAGAAKASAGWVKEQGVEAADKARVTATAVDKSVHHYPWAYVGGAAATGFVLGLLLGRRR